MIMSSKGEGRKNSLAMVTKVRKEDRASNLVPRAFLRRGEDGREKTLASVGHVIFKHPEKLGVIN